MQGAESWTGESKSKSQKSIHQNPAGKFQSISHS